MAPQSEQAGTVEAMDGPGSMTRLEVPSLSTWRQMVDEPGGHIWHCKRSTLLLCLLHQLFLMVAFGFVFLDDYWWVLRSFMAPLLNTALLAILLALVTPVLSWKKMALLFLVGSNAWLVLLLGNLSPEIDALAFRFSPFLFSPPLLRKRPPWPRSPSGEGNASAD